MYQSIDVRDEIIGFRHPKQEEAYAYHYDGLSTKEFKSFIRSTVCGRDSFVAGYSVLTS
jgi:hypothetical protein